MELKLHPDLKGSLSVLCEDKQTTVIVLSGSDRSVLDSVMFTSDFALYLPIFALIC
jgi:hypothetical protein